MHVVQQVQLQQEAQLCHSNPSYAKFWYRRHSCAKILPQLRL